MGTAQSREAESVAPPSPATYDVRVIEGGCENPRSLHFVDPAGKPAWRQDECNYVAGLPNFEAAQRVCRQIMTTPEFVPGTRVQFFKGGHRIKHSTVLKP